MTTPQRIYLVPADVDRLRALKASLQQRAVGSLIRLLISEALAARGLPPLTPIAIGYPKGRKRR